MSCASPRPGPRRAAERLTRQALAAFLLLALVAAAPTAAGWWDDAAEARETRVSELRRAPESWRDVPVLLRVRFGGVGERVQPYFTQFTPERWQPVTLLPRDAESATDGELRTAFVARGGRDDLRIARINPNRPVLVRAVVRDAVAGEPWVEILAITLDGDPLTPEEQTRIHEADRFLERRNPEAAERLYRNVLSERRLADRDRATILRQIGVALHDQGRAHDALAAFREALAADPDDLDVQHRTAHLEDALARAPLAPSADGVPPTAGSAARPTPEPTPTPDTPLLLPGRDRGLAPPKGLPTPAADAPAADSGSPELPAPPKPRLALPGPKSPSGARPVVETPAPKKPVTDEPEAEEEPEEELPPPVPARPKLSGPK